MLHLHNKLFHRANCTCDLALIGGSLHLSTLLGPVAGTWTSWTKTWQTGLVLLCWLVVSCYLEIYRSRRTDRFPSELAELFKAWVISLSLGCLLTLIAWGGIFYHPLSAGALGLLFLCVQRYSIRTVLRQLRFRGRNYRRVVLVGNGPAAARIVRDIQENPLYGIRICGHVTFTEEEDHGSGLRHLGNTTHLDEIISNESVDSVVVCPPVNARIGEMNRVFALCDEAGIQCLCSLGFNLSYLHTTVGLFAGCPTISFTAQRPAHVCLVVKRLSDVVVSAGMLVAATPFLLIASALIKLRDRGPIFFNQVRVGEGGRLFTCYKFRTMCVDAEKKKAELLSRNEQDGPVFKMRHDPRVTPVGRFLRKYSLDELPQLFNVLIGDMSMVGPRPPTPDEVQRYEWSQRRRLSVRPGITCIWQVWGRNKVSFKRWLEMDLYYIDNWSLFMDFKLMCHTVVTVMRGTGS